MVKDHAHGVEYFRELVVDPVRHTFMSLDTHPLAKATVGIVFAPFATFMQDNHAGVQIMVILVLLDLLAGSVRAMKKGKFSSAKLRNTVWKVLAYTIIVVSLHLIESLHPAFASLSLDTLATLYLSATEALSILENTTSMLGIELPEKIKKAIEQIGKGKKDSEEPK